MGADGQAQQVADLDQDPQRWENEATPGSRAAVAVGGMTHHRLIAIALVVTIGVVGCGGSGVEAFEPEEVAAMIGCSTTFEADTTEELFVQDVGSCRISGEEVRLLAFASNDARDSFAEIGEEFGGRFVKGPSFLVEVPNAKIQEQVEAALD